MERYEELRLKYESNTINKDEMFEYLQLKKKHDADFCKGRELFEIRYDNNSKINISKRLPKEFGLINEGRFYNLIYFLYKDNSLRNNEKYITNEFLFEKMQIKSYSMLRRIINKFVSFNIIKECVSDNKEKYFLINPSYAIGDGFVLTKKIFDMFKNDIILELDFLINYIDDLEVLEEVKPFISEIDYQKIAFKLNPQAYYTIFNTPVKESGIYILIKDNQIMYIGKSNNMYNRICQHKKDKEFDRVKCIAFKNEADVNLYEPYLINKYKPIHNRDLILECENNIKLPDIEIGDLYE